MVSLIQYGFFAELNFDGINQSVLNVIVLFRCNIHEYEYEHRMGNGKIQRNLHHVYVNF